MSEESTLCDLPSVRVTRRSTTGWPSADAALHLRAHPLLDAGDELAGYRAADDLVDELEAGPLGQRLDLDVADGELAVAAGLLHVPAVALGRPGEGLAQGDRERHLVDVHAVPRGQPLEQRPRRAPRPCTTAPAGGSRRCSRSAATGPRRRAGPSAWESLSSSALLCATIATGSSGSGIDQGRSTRGLVDRGERVAGLGPGEPADRAQVAGDDARRPGTWRGRRGAPARRSARPRRGRRGRRRRRRTT